MAIAQESRAGFKYGESHQWLAGVAQDNAVPDLSRDIAAEAGAQGLNVRGLAHALHLSDRGLENFLLSGELHRKDTIAHAATFLSITEDEARSKLPLPFCQCAGRCGERVKTAGAKYVRGHNRRGLVNCECGCGEWIDPVDDRGRRRRFISAAHARRAIYSGAARSVASLEQRANDETAIELVRLVLRKAVAERLPIGKLAQQLGMNRSHVWQKLFLADVGFARSTVRKFAEFLGISLMTAETKFPGGSYEKYQRDRGMVTGRRAHKREALKKRVPLPELMKEKGRNLYEAYRWKHPEGPPAPPSRKGAKETLIQRQRRAIAGKVRAFGAGPWNRNRAGEFVSCTWCGQLLYMKRTRIEDHRAKRWSYYFHGGCYRTFQRQFGSRRLEEQEAEKETRTRHSKPLPKNVSQRVLAWLLLRAMHFESTALAGPGRTAELVRRWAADVEGLIPDTWDQLFPNTGTPLSGEPIRGEWFPIAGARRYRGIDGEGLLAGMDPDHDTALHVAVEFLWNLLAHAKDRSVPFEEVETAARSQDFEWRTLERAKRHLRVRSTQVGTGKWVWQLLSR